MKKRIISIVLIIVMVLGVLPVLSSEGFAQDATIAKLSAGSYVSAVVKTDGTLWVWGDRGSGQPGVGYITNSSTPVQVMSEVADVSVGASFIMVIKTDGTLWAWGYNSVGQLGDGTTVEKSTPVQIMSGVSRVYSGSLKTMAIKTDGTLWAWGFNINGDLGDGTKTNRSTPVKVMDDVSDVGLGTSHTVALKTDGTLWAWGDNYFGELGDGTTTDRSYPVKVMSGVSDVDAASGQSFAVKTDGTLWAWGKNWSGELGDGTTTDRTAPILVMSGAKSVFAAAGHTIAIKTDGTLWAWGSNNKGALGDGTTINRTSPVQVNNNISLVSADDHTMILKTDGTLWAWGWNYYGQLGDGTTIDRSAPVQITVSGAGLGTLDNFIKTIAYTPNQFSDVPSSAWFAENVANAYELGLMKGNSDSNFNAAGNTSIAETVVLACRLHSIYYADGKEFTQGLPWYQVYVDYAFDNGILSYAFSDYSKAATRAEFAIILSKALPSEALSVINAIPDDTIPDIPSSASYSKGVYCLYRAGVITGSDSAGTFNPNSTIGRNEVAAIVTRMAIENLRKSVAFEKITPTGITISQTSLSIEAGKTVTLTAMVSPSNAADKSVKWSSSNYSVATVSNGVVKGLTAGTATITATTSNGFTAQCLVTVSSSVVYYSGYYPAPDFGAYMNVNAFATESIDKMTMFVYKAQDITVSSEIALKGYLDLLFENGFYYVTKRYDSENMPVLIYKNDAYGVSVLIGAGMISGYACVKIAVTND